MRNLITFFILLSVGFQVNAQVKQEVSLVKWHTIEEAEKLNQKQKRPIFIDVYTDWCGWCKRMMSTTFSTPGIAQYINNNFYAVRYNAETMDTIEFQGKKWVNKETGKRRTHELAKMLLNNRLSYPTIVYIDREGKINPVPGYQTAAQIEPILLFFGEDIYKNAAFNDFDRYFKFSFPSARDTAKDPYKYNLDTNGVINWMSFEEALQKSKKEPRQLFVEIFYEYSVSGKVMKLSTQKNKIIADYINEKYYPIRLNATSQDTIVINGNELINGGTGNYALHPLAGELLAGNVKFPTYVWLSSKFKLLNRIQGFFPSKTFDIFLRYLGDEKFKTIKWPEYQKTFKTTIID